MSRSFTTSLAFLALVSAASGAESGKTPPAFGEFTLTSTKEPIQVSSDKLEFDYKGRKAIFRGGVEVVQGEIQLGADTLTVVYSEVGKEQQLREVIAEGGVKIVQGVRKATGKRAVFDQSNRTLVLTGDAVLEEGANQINGDTIVVYPDESRMEVKGDNRRVKVFLFPKQDGGLSKPEGSKPDGAKPEGAAPPAAKASPAPKNADDDAATGG